MSIKACFYFFHLSRKSSGAVVASNPLICYQRSSQQDGSSASVRDSMNSFLVAGLSSRNLEEYSWLSIGNKRTIAAVESLSLKLDDIALPDVRNVSIRKS